MKILYCSLDVKGTSFVSRVSTEFRFLFTLHTKNLLRAFYEYQYYNYKKIYKSPLSLFVRFFK